MRTYNIKKLNDISQCETGELLIVAIALIKTAIWRDDKTEQIIDKLQAARKVVTENN